MTFDQLPDVLTVEEVGAYLRIGRNSAYELSNRQDFPVVKVGRCKRVPKKAFGKWLEEVYQAKEAR